MTLDNQFRKGLVLSYSKGEVMNDELEGWEKNLSHKNGARIDCVEVKRLMENKIKPDIKMNPTEYNKFRLKFIERAHKDGVTKTLEHAFLLSRSSLYHWLRNEEAIRNNTYGNRKKSRPNNLAAKYEEVLDRVKVLEAELSGIKSLFRDKLGV